MFKTTDFTCSIDLKFQIFALLSILIVSLFFTSTIFDYETLSGSHGHSFKMPHKNHWSRTDDDGISGLHYDLVISDTLHGS